MNTEAQPDTSLKLSMNFLLSSFVLIMISIIIIHSIRPVAFCVTNNAGIICNQYFILFFFPIEFVSIDESITYIVRIIDTFTKVIVMIVAFKVMSNLYTRFNNKSREFSVSDFLFYLGLGVFMYSSFYAYLYTEFFKRQLVVDLVFYNLNLNIEVQLALYFSLILLILTFASFILKNNSYSIIDDENQKMQRIDFLKMVTLILSISLILFLIGNEVFDIFIHDSFPGASEPFFINLFLNMGSCIILGFIVLRFMEIKGKGKISTENLLLMSLIFLIGYMLIFGINTIIRSGSLPESEILGYFLYIANSAILYSIPSIISTIVIYYWKINDLKLA
ncbi:MAG: hypothetical protein ACW98A_06350 [Candidatus Hodarchaeales archaeon]